MQFEQLVIPPFSRITLLELLFNTIASALALWDALKLRPKGGPEAIPTLLCPEIRLRNFQGQLHKNQVAQCEIWFAFRASRYLSGPTVSGHRLYTNH